jgi:integrase
VEAMETVSVGGRPISRELTIPELITFSQKSERRTSSTYKSYCRNLEAFLEKNWSSLSTMTSLDAKAFIQQMGKYNSDTSRYDEMNTAVAYKRFMRALFNSLGRREDSLWLRNNMKEVKPINKFKVDIPIEQILKLIEITLSDKKQPYSKEFALGWSLMAFDGLRPGEILGFYYEDMDLESKQINLQRHEGERYFPKATKVGDPPTPIPLNDFSIQLFSQVNKHEPNSRVIPVSYKTLRKYFCRYCEKAGVEDREGNKVTLHKMRHVFGHFWRNNKGDLQVLKEVMRHSDIRITMIYSAPSTGEINSEFEQTININLPASKSDQEMTNRNHFTIQ